MPFASLTLSKISSVKLTAWTCSSAAPTSYIYYNNPVDDWFKKMESGPSSSIINCVNTFEKADLSWSLMNERVQHSWILSGSSPLATPNLESYKPKPRWFSISISLSFVLTSVKNISPIESVRKCMKAGETSTTQSRNSNIVQMMRMHFSSLFLFSGVTNPL